MCVWTARFFVKSDGPLRDRATYLTAIGEPPDPPPLCPARAPPQLMFDEFEPNPDAEFTDDDFCSET